MNQINNDKRYKVYMHTNLINGKKYIGETSRKFVSTRFGHNGKRYEDQPKFYNDIIKYGWDNFKHEILSDNLTHDEAINLEKELIAKYDTMNTGYNNSIGDQGCTGYHQTEEAKQKISKAQTGRERSIKDKEKVKEFFDEYYKTHEHYMTGKHQTQEAKEKFKKSFSGENNPNYHKYGYANPTSKTVLQFTKQGIFVKEYGSAREAARENNYTYNHIGECSKLKSKSSNGFIWRWKNGFTDQDYNCIINKTKMLFEVTYNIGS